MMDILLFLLPLSAAGNVAFILTLIGDIKKAREKETRIRLLEAEVVALKSKKYRKVVRFLDPHGMPQNRLDEEIGLYQVNGWTFDEQYSVNGLLAFYKEEEMAQYETPKANINTIASAFRKEIKED
jgi:hypothetical protein